MVLPSDTPFRADAPPPAVGEKDCQELTDRPFTVNFLSCHREHLPLSDKFFQGGNL